MQDSHAKLPSVNLTKYVKVSDGQWRFCPVVFAANGREESHAEGNYFIEWRENGKRRRETVGNSAPDAHAAKDRKELTAAER